MASRPINFDDLGGKQISPPTGKIDFSDLEVTPSSSVPSAITAAISSIPHPKDAVLNAPEESGLLTGPQTTGVEGAEQGAARTAKAMVSTAAQMPSALAHLFSAPSDEEKQTYKDRIELSSYARPLLAGERFLGQPLVTAYRAYGPGDTPEKRMVNEANLPEALPEALGSSTTQYFTGKAAGELMDKALPKGGTAEATPTRTTMMSRALRPGGKAAKNFRQNVQNAYPAVQDEIAQNQGQVPASLGEFNDLLGSARRRVWAQVQDLLARAQAKRPPVKGLLQSAPGEINTGVQQVTGEGPGGVIPSEPAGGPKASEPVQFLSGGEHPEMSGRLTNPATLITRDTAALEATRNRLASVINDQETFSKLGPAEQEAYAAQLNRLNKLLEAPKGVPHGPAIDGTAVANAIEKSVRPRPKMFGQTSELQARANAYRGRRIPLTDAEELLQDANREASAWYLAHDPHGPQLQASAAAEASAIRDQLYKQIDALSESDPGTYQQLKRTYGALEALQDFTQKRIPVASRQAPLNWTETGGLMAGLELLAHAHDLKSALASPLPWLAAKGARYVNSPEFLLKQSLKQPSNVPVPIRAGAVAAARTAPTWAPVNKNKSVGQRAADYVEKKYPGFFTGKRR